MTLLPSLPAQSFAEIADLAAVLADVADEFQVDMVDGIFVPLTSWPFTEQSPVEELSKLAEIAKHFSLEMDCMVNDPGQYFDAFTQLGVDRIIIHVGSTDDHEAISSRAQAEGWKLGLACTNDVDLEEIFALLPLYEYVQVMGIREVGQQGQPFDERTIETVRHLKEYNPELEVAVDGAVNTQSIPVLRAAGVDRFAPGSAIAKQPDPKAAFLQLQSLLEQ